MGELEKVKSMRVVQARINSAHMSVFKASDRWFQLTCEFETESGDKFYHILERNQKGKFFKILKFYMA